MKIYFSPQNRIGYSLHFTAGKKRKRKMKLFSLLLSVIMFFVSLYFFSIQLGSIDSLNDVIYISLLVTLMAICVVGVIINWDILKKKKKNKENVILFVSNSFSRKEKKNKK